jgi:hypothetical protein
MNALLKLAAPAAFLFVGTAAVSAGKQDFDLVNATGYVISEVYVAPSSSNEWEEDVMGRDVLGVGETVTIEFAPRQKACNYDIKVVWDDGDEAFWQGFDLCTVSEVTLHWDDGRAWAEYE